MRRSKLSRAVIYALLLCFTNLVMQPLALAVGQPSAPSRKIQSNADELLAGRLETIARIASRAKDPTKSSRAVAEVERLARQAVDLGNLVESRIRSATTQLKNSGATSELVKRQERSLEIFIRNKASLEHLFQELSLASEDPDTRAQILASIASEIRQHGSRKNSRHIDVSKMSWKPESETKRTPVRSMAKKVKALPSTPSADDLSPTVDAQITPDIAAKALGLDNDPLKIYQWVRNNVRYRPTFGSAQGAQDTLEKLQGNAFDIASLLVALLRSAGIPSRYVYGQIELPIARVSNWVGGANNAVATSQVLGRGGIPNTLITSAGVISSIRMEHVWVEAWVNFAPPRGAKGGAGNAWIPLDAAYKQYVFTPGMGLATHAPFDEATFQNLALDGATIDAAGGWVQAADLSKIHTQFAAYQSATADYIHSQNPSPTLGDVFGAASIVVEAHPVFEGTLPYSAMAGAQKFTELPDTLRHKFTYNVYASDADRDSDSPVIAFTDNLPTLVGKKISLTFAAATPADAQLMSSFVLPDNPDGSPNLLTSFPTAANVTAELRVNGKVVAQGGSFPLGTELAARGGFTTLDLSGWDTTDDNSIIAGQVSLIGVSVHGISQRNVADLQARMGSNITKLQSGDTADIRGGPKNLGSPLSVISARRGDGIARWLGDENGKAVEKKPRGGVQGESGLGGDPRGQDDGGARDAVRRARASDHRVEEATA